MKYRPDIDGLRAIAVVSVIIFHIWPYYLHGGFVGVDIFFVISGYIITSLISSQLDNNSFSLLDFYARRVKRIMPMCWLIIFLCYFVSIVVLLPNDLINFSGSARAASLYLTNIFFIKNNNYFALNSNELPLLHFWSLAVEEQFYMVYPFILMIIYKVNNFRVRLIFLCLSIIFVVSLTASIYCGYMGYNNFSYYSILTRSFELSFGALIFYLNILIIQKTRFAKSVFLGNLLGIVGLIFVILSILFINETYVFPSYIALLPVVGAGIIILSGSINRRTLIYRLLSLKVFVGIGLISYSLYLWHWPILAFWHYEFPLQQINLLAGITVIIITLLLSIISYYLLETTIRHSKIGILKTFIILQIIPVLVLCFGREYIMKNNGFYERLDGTMQTTKKFSIENNLKVYKDGYYIGGAALTSPPKILLVGDSHAARYTPFWNYLGLKWGFNIVFMSYKGCHALISRSGGDQSIENNVNSDGCRKLIHDFTKDYMNYDVIVMAGRWGNDLSDESSIISGQKFSLINGDTYESDYERTIHELTSNGKKIIIMGDSPNDRNSSIDAYYRHKFLARYDFFQSASSNSILSFDFYDNHVANNIMKNFASKYQNVYYFDFNEDVLSHIKSFPFINGNLLYIDFNHLSEDGSLNLAESFVTFDSSKKMKYKLREFGIIQ